MRAGQNRFKQWWHLVGSAVEFAAELCDDKPPVDFKQLFLDVEADDEEAASLAEALMALDRLSDEAGKFGAAEASKCMHAENESDEAKILKSFFAGRNGIPSKKSITEKLKCSSDCPTWVGDEIWILKKGKDAHTKIVEFHIEKKGQNAGPLL